MQILQLCEKLKDGGYRPKVEFMSNPNVKADIKVESGGISWIILSALANLLISIFKRKIINMGIDEGEPQLPLFWLESSYSWLKNKIILKLYLDNFIKYNF